jgi:hypothetical protein
MMVLQRSCRLSKRTGRHVMAGTSPTSSSTAPACRYGIWNRSLGPPPPPRPRTTRGPIRTARPETKAGSRLGSASISWIRRTWMRTMCWCRPRNRLRAGRRKWFGGQWMGWKSLLVFLTWLIFSNWRPETHVVCRHWIRLLAGRVLI